MATAVGKRRTRRKVSGTAAVGRRRSTRRRVSGTAAVGRRRSTRRRVSGTAAVGRTHRRRTRRVGSMSATGLMKEVLPMAVGMAAGVGVQHFLLRPLEAKIAQKVPMAAKFMAVGEILLGGFIALKAKQPIIKGLGLGIMAGGVQTGVKQLNIYHESPAVQGVGDYTTVRIPVNGQMREMLNGVIRNHDGITHTSLVAGSDEMGWSYQEREQVSRTNLLAGIYGLDTEEDALLPPKGGY